MQGSNIVKAESPVWNQRELILSDPVHIAKFEDDHEAAVNFYYK